MKIDINLSDNKSIDSAIEQLKSLELGSEFDNKMVDKLVKECYEKCLENLQATKGYPSTQYRQIASAISTTPAQDGVGYVNIKAPATFVEMGTGLPGASSPNPLASEIGWSYGTDKEGWIYPTNEGASNPNKKQNKQGQWFGFTRGQTAKAFGYKAALYIKETAKDKIITSFTHKWEE